MNIKNLIEKRVLPIFHSQGWAVFTVGACSTSTVLSLLDAYQGKSVIVSLATALVSALAVKLTWKAATKKGGYSALLADSQSDIVALHNLGKKFFQRFVDNLGLYELKVFDVVEPGQVSKIVGEAQTVYELRASVNLPRSMNLLELELFMEHIVDSLCCDIMKKVEPIAGQPLILCDFLIHTFFQKVTAEEHAKLMQEHYDKIRKKTSVNSFPNPPDTLARNVEDVNSVSMWINVLR